ncbi:MAG: LPS export ABC transporter periplasmic protein LptC [Sulfuricurvum sp.]|nr:LPS export ABC transporter periplasmic protein LptC [Sulfuricurvum sp.]
MSINLFFIFVLSFLVGMYGYFTPKFSPANDVKEIPQIELNQFKLYEISKRGVDHVLEGEKGERFEDRYTVASAKFSDNTKHLFQFVSSDQVEYKADRINLKQNVHYIRADGLEFRSREGIYDTKRSVIQTDGAFVITQKAHRIDGDRLIYDTERDTVSAKRVQIHYQLK